MTKAVEKQILRLEHEEAQAFNHRDVRGAVHMFDKSFVGFSSTQHERIRGLGALTKTFHHYLALSPKMAYRIEKPHVHVSGNTAVATFYWAVDLGGKRKIHGRGTHVFTRKGRQWRVVHEHFSRAH
jgi:ketosteroid isomerase-like protein